jgi:hypothetical protein
MKRLFTKNDCANGFLTVELLVSATILLFILVSMIPLFTLAVRENAASKDMTVAWSLAMDKIEELHNVEYEDLPSGASSDEIYVKNVKFTRTWTVTDNAPQGGMKTVTVEVFTLVDRSFGKPKKASLTLYRIPRTL